MVPVRHAGCCEGGWAARHNFGSGFSSGIVPDPLSREGQVWCPMMLLLAGHARLWNLRGCCSSLALATWCCCNRCMGTTSDDVLCMRRDYRAVTLPGAHFQDGVDCNSMRHTLAETCDLYTTALKAAVNTQMKAFGSSWKKILNNDLQLYCITQQVCCTQLHSDLFLVVCFSVVCASVCSAAVHKPQAFVLGVVSLSQAAAAIDGVCLALRDCDKTWEECLLNSTVMCRQASGDLCCMGAGVRHRAGDGLTV
jgi:hypothetical protein